MKTLLTLGTSHMTDKHYDQYGPDHKAWNSYVHWDKGEQRWVEYLADKLGYNLRDMSYGSYGIDTYAQRLFASIEGIDVALIEIPDYNRHEIYVGNTDNRRSLRKDFWTGLEHKNHVYKYTTGDYNKDHSITQKFKTVNQHMDLPLSNGMINSAIELIAVKNTQLAEDKIWATITMMDGYLASKNIDTYWFSWNFGIDSYCYDVNTLQGTLINTEPFINDYDPEYFVDGAHLTSEL